MTGRAPGLAPALLLTATLAAGAGPEVHGESNVFAAPGVTVAWGVLRAPVEDDTQVVIRVAVTGAAYGWVRVDAVDPFGGGRRVVAPGGAVGGGVDVRGPRASFAEFPRREIRLYRTAQAWRGDDPALTIYYLGVPDTTPEFAAEPALASYLAEAIARAAR